MSRRAHNFNADGVCVICGAPEESTGDGGIFPICNPAEVKAICDAIDAGVMRMNETTERRAP